MTLSRRTFIKGMAATAFTASGLVKLFSSEVSAEMTVAEIRKRAVTRAPGARPLYRNAVSLGPTRTLTIRDIRRAKDALIQWVKDKRITTDVNRVRFMYSEDDFGHELGIGVSIYDRPMKGYGLTWGEVERLIKEEIGIA